MMKNSPRLAYIQTMCVFQKCSHIYGGGYHNNIFFSRVNEGNNDDNYECFKQKISANTIQLLCFHTSVVCIYLCCDYLLYLHGELSALNSIIFVLQSWCCCC